MWELKNLKESLIDIINVEDCKLRIPEEEHFNSIICVKDNKIILNSNSYLYDSEINIWWSNTNAHSNIFQRIYDNFMIINHNINQIIIRSSLLKMYVS